MTHRCSLGFFDATNTTVGLIDPPSLVTWALAGVQATLLALRSPNTPGSCRRWAGPYACVTEARWPSIALRP